MHVLTVFRKWVVKLDTDLRLSRCLLSTYCRYGQFPCVKRLLNVYSKSVIFNIRNARLCYSLTSIHCEIFSVYFLSKAKTSYASLMTILFSGLNAMG